MIVVVPELFEVHGVNAKGDSVVFAAFDAKSLQMSLWVLLLSLYEFLLDALSEL